MGLGEAIIKLLIYNVTTLKEIVPNLLLGLVIGLSSGAILYRLARIDKDYITFTRNNFFFLLILVSVGAVIVSPLDAGRMECLKTISVLFTLICLSVCSYTDLKTKTVIVGYVLLGMLIQVILLVCHIANNGLWISGIEKTILVITLVLFLFFCIIRSYTIADLGLIYMNAMCILVCADKLHFVYCILMVFVAFITVAIRDIFFRIPQRKKEGKKGKLRFSFTLHILIGMMASLFFI